MELSSFIGCGIVLSDFILLSLFLVTLYLGIGHIFDKSLGTELDLFISIFFLLIFLIYNYILTDCYQILWNRNLELFIILLINIVFMFLLGMLFKSEENRRIKT